MKKIAVLIENLFDEQELIYPYHRLREDYQVDLIGSEAGKEYSGKSGSFKLKSDLSSSEANPDDYIGVYIPGGYSPDGMRGCKDTVDFVKSIHNSGKLVASICHGPWLLVDALDLEGVKVTSTGTIKNDLINAGAQWVDEEVVESENIITSRSPKDLPAQLKVITEKLKSL